MTKETDLVIKKLKDYYNLDVKTENEDTIIVDGATYQIPSGMDTNYYENLVSYINAQSLTNHISENYNKNLFTKYKGYFLVADPTGDGINVYDSEGELFDEGYGSVEDAKAEIDKEISKDSDYDVDESLTNVSQVLESTQLEEDAIQDSYPVLIVALDSEKDAVITYESLIENEKSEDIPNQEVIDLLTKILVDEKEHIALLSALQAKNAGKFVADDAKEEFNSYIDSIDSAN